MAALSNLPYPLATFISHNAQIRPKRLMIQSSIRVLTRRKNYLRPKILKTLIKPYPVREDPGTPVEVVEPSIEAPCEPNLENLGFEIVEGSEMLGGVDESEGSDQFLVAQVSESWNAVGFSWFSGRMVVRIVASFVGLFVLQTVVAVWLVGTGESDEKKGGKLKNEGEHTGSPNGNAFQENLAYMTVDGLEVEAKIAEIRKLAREAREIEKRSLENGEADMEDVSDDDEEDGLQAETSRVRSGIVKEVDGRLTKLRKKSPTLLVNSNLLNKPQELAEEAKNGGLEGKEDDNKLMFEMKPRFKNNMRARDKPKGFQSIKGSRGVEEKLRNMDSNASSLDEDQEINDLNRSFPEIDEKKPGSRSSSPSRNMTKKTGNGSETSKSNQEGNNSAGTRGHSAKEKLNNGMNKGAKTKRGVVQDSSHGNPVDQAANLTYSSAIATQSSQMKAKNPKVSTTSEMHTDKQQNGDLKPWWLSLPYALVILMRKNSKDGEEIEGFYTLKVYSDTENKSYKPYIVAFEAPNDARNFSYILESVFDDLPDASIDIAPLPTKELKQVAESLENEVIVVKKGQLKLYAGQPLDEVDAALKSLLNSN